MVKLFFIYAHLLSEGLARRYTFPVDLFFIGSFIHETLTNNVYLERESFHFNQQKKYKLRYEIREQHRT